MFTEKDFTDFKINYNNVFNDDGSVKACGRTATKQLILACVKLNPYENFGDSLTGFMNVRNIQNLYNTYIA